MRSVLLLLAAFATLSVWGQGDQRKSPHDTVSNAHASVTYGRPYKKGRAIFGALEPFGKVYRVGADEATTITFKNAVKFGDQAVPAGTYTLFAIPNEKEWTIILNGQLGQWGAFSYEKNKDKDVAKINVPVKKLDNIVEQLTISFADNNSLVIAWDQTQVTVPLRF
jgi:Protein of unknown function (DUF2911)